jgi:hypothetical protein
MGESDILQHQLLKYPVSFVQKHVCERDCCRQQPEPHGTVPVSAGAVSWNRPDGPVRLPTVRAFFYCILRASLLYFLKNKTTPNPNPNPHTKTKTLTNRLDFSASQMTRTPLQVAGMTCNGHDVNLQANIGCLSIGSQVTVFLNADMAAIRAINWQRMQQQAAAEGGDCCIS